MVIACAIIVEAGAIIVSPCELRGIRIGRSGGRRLAERLKRVLRLYRSGRRRESDSRSQGVGHEAPRAGGVGPGKHLVDSQARQQVRARRTARDLLHRVGAIIEEARAGARDRARTPAPDAIVREAGAADCREAIPGVPCVALRAVVG